MTIIFRNPIHDGTKFYYLCQRFHPMMFLESLFKLRIRRESAQLKTVLELYDMEIHQKISMPNYQQLKTLVKGSIDQNFDYETLTPGMGEMKQEQ